MDRSFEREIIPMAKSEGLALAPWNVLAGGKIRTDQEEEKRRQTGENGRIIFDPKWERNEKEKIVCKALEKVAKEVGAKHITAGMFPPPFSYSMFINRLFSCYCVLDAEDALRLPHCGRSKS